MQILSGYLDEAYATWIDSSANCCSPRRAEAPRLGAEKPMRIEHHQPRLVPPPIPEPQEDGARGREWVTRTRSFASRASSRGSFAVRRKLNAYNGFHSHHSQQTPRRPRIGAPSDFRHVENSMTRRTEVFRPLELSIYMPENQLSPILPHFGTIDDMSYADDDLKDLPYPPAFLSHSRSESAMSFRIPRKPLRSSSRSSSEWTAQFKPRPDSLSTNELLAALEHQLPRSPPPARLRSFTEPPAYERVKSALHEKYELEQRLKDIEEIIEERKSVYFNSRPTSRAVSRPTSVYSEAQEPMPPPPQPALPPVPIPPMAPSFAERVTLPHADQRPKTAPGPPKNTVHIPARLTPFTQASAAFTTPSPSSTSTTSSGPPSRPERALPPPPPLPLVLQPHPPLRKKKSFSGKVSNWLFPATDSEHSGDISQGSITNTPKPVTSREGFYQCIDLQQPPARTSIDTASTVSTLESELEPPMSMGTTWTMTNSPESSPGRERAEKEVEIRSLSIDSMREASNDLTRVRTFGEKDGGKDGGQDESWRMAPLPANGHGRNSVGVAF